MDTLQSMWVFRHIVEMESFSKAAEYMDITTESANKYLNHLEKTVQAKLLNRTSSSVSMTKAGQDYYKRCVDALDTLTEANLIAQVGNIRPRGSLKIIAPTWCATAQFAQILAEYQQTYPEVILSVTLDSRRSDLVAEGIDIALLVNSNTDPDLIVQPITSIDFLWVASPDYLIQQGKMHTLNEIKLQQGILPQPVKLNTPMTATSICNNEMLMHQMALNHMGLALLPEWLIKEDLLAGRLQTIQYQAGTNSHILYAAYLNRESLSAKIRSFIDFLSDKFKLRNSQN
jgi:DNA-binding transcriptional LysR family regulator